MNIEDKFIKMNKKQFLRIINLQRQKMVDVLKDTEDCYTKNYNLLDDEEKIFIDGFIAKLRNDKEDNIAEWIEKSIWEKGWSLKDIFFQLNFKPFFPLLYKEYFDVPEKTAQKFKYTYKNLSFVLFDKYPHMAEWRIAMKKHYETYRRKLQGAFLDKVLHYDDKEISGLNGISSSASADILSKMRTYHRAPKKKIQEENVIKKLREGKKQMVIAKEEGISQGQVSKIKARMVV